MSKDSVYTWLASKLLTDGTSRPRAFVWDTEGELVDGLAPTGAPVEWVKESSYVPPRAILRRAIRRNSARNFPTPQPLYRYFFKLSKWREPLEAHIRANDDFIAPISRRNEVLSFMREGLRDLSISRTTFDWGVGKGMIWAVSQAAPLRRVQVDNDLCLFEYQPPIQPAGEASGGFSFESPDDEVCVAVPAVPQQ